MITPFHFACFAEEQLRALCRSSDASLGNFLKITRHNSLSKHRAKLSFAAANATETAHVELMIDLVPQKEAQTALNCFLSCPSGKQHQQFRILLSRVDESQTQISKIFAFLQKAFAPLNYKSYVPSEGEAVAAPKGQRTVVATSENEDEVTLPDNNKYILEKNPMKGEAVKMRTREGKYVPEGELPAKLVINS